VYGSVRTVVWQGSVGDRRPYADQIPLSQVPRRQRLGSLRTLRAGAPVDRALRFIARYRRTGNRQHDGRARQHPSLMNQRTSKFAPLPQR
jgi:hypothetical protein